jgi:GABA(A) receptor-associated protein
MNNLFQTAVQIFTPKSSCNNFKAKYSYSERKEMFEKISERFPERIPLIIERVDPAMPELDRCKFLIPPCLTMGNLQYIIRKRVKLTAEQALFLLVKDVIPPTVETVGNIYVKSRDDDGFLYVKYTSENTFGKLY